MNLCAAKFTWLGDNNLNGKTVLRFYVENISFHRFLQPKDILIIEKTDISKIRPGDFVFGRNSSLQEGLFQVIKSSQKDRTEVLKIRDTYELYFNDKLYPQELVGRLLYIERNHRRIRFDTFIHTIQKKVEIILLSLKIKLGELVKIISSSKPYKYFVRKSFSGVKFKYRIADIGDVPKIARLFICHHWPMPVQEINKKIYCLFSELQDNGYCFVACKENKIIGFLIAKKGYAAEGQEYFWYLDMLYVDPLYRRLKIGLHLFLFAIREAFKRNLIEFRGVSIKSIYLYTQKAFINLGLKEFVSLSVEEKSISAPNGLSYKQLNYVLKIINPKMLMEYSG